MRPALSGGRLSIVSLLLVLSATGTGCGAKLGSLGGSEQAERDLAASESVRERPVLGNRESRSHARRRVVGCLTTAQRAAFSDDECSTVGVVIQASYTTPGSSVPVPSGGGGFTPGWYWIDSSGVVSDSRPELPDGAWYWVSEMGEAIEIEFAGGSGVTPDLPPEGDPLESTGSEGGGIGEPEAPKDPCGSPVLNPEAANGWIQENGCRRPILWTTLGLKEGSSTTGFTVLGTAKILAEAQSSTATFEIDAEVDGTSPPTVPEIRMQMGANDPEAFTPGAVAAGSCTGAGVEISQFSAYSTEFDSVMICDTQLAEYLLPS